MPARGYAARPWGSTTTWSPGGATCTAIPRSASRSTRRPRGSRTRSRASTGWRSSGRPRRASWRGCAPAGPGRRSRCGRTSTRCRSTRRAASSSRPSGRARCTRAGTTGTPRCCSAPRASWRARELPGGELRFIFQHAEELAPGGARDMVAAGVMEGVDFVYGCHLWTPLEYGKVAAVPGPFMAAADFFTLTITGRGGHAGLPHTAVDTIACRGGARRQPAAHRLAPDRPAAARGGHRRQLHAGDAPNVIPGEAVLTGTTRSFDPDVRQRIPKLIEEIAAGVCAAHGATHELDFQFGYKPVVNDERATALVREAVGRPSSSRSTRSWAATTSRPSRPRPPGATRSSAPAASTRTITRASGSTSGRSRSGRGCTSRSPSELSRCSR